MFRYEVRLECEKRVLFKTFKLVHVTDALTSLSLADVFSSFDDDFASTSLSSDVVNLVAVTDGVVVVMVVEPISEFVVDDVSAKSNQENLLFKQKSLAVCIEIFSPVTADVLADCVIGTTSSSSSSSSTSLI